MQITQLSEQQQNQWGGWAPWSTCSFNCTGSDAERGRSQSRTRQVLVDGVVSQTETERRPCNAMEYAGNNLIPLTSILTKQLH